MKTIVKVVVSINIYCTYLTVFHITLDVLLIDALNLYFNPSPIVLFSLSIICNTANCLLLKTDYMRARRLRKATDQRARSCTRMHTHSYAHTVFPTPVSRRVPSPTAPLSTARPGNTTSSSYSRNKLWQGNSEPRSPMRLTAAADGSREREGAREKPWWLSTASAVGRRREHSIGRIWTACSRRSEEGGRSAKQSAAEQSTQAAPAFCRLPPCRFL